MCLDHDVEKCLKTDIDSWIHVQVSITGVQSLVLALAA